MELKQYIDLVKKHFGFLIDKYGFSIIHSREYESFGNCYVVLQWGDCRIRVGMERGTVVIHAGLRYAPHKEFIFGGVDGTLDNWYDLYSLTRFLTKDPNQADWDYMFPEPGFDEETRVERQMSRLAKILEPYGNQIIELFQEDTFKKRQKELDDFIRKQAEERWGIVPDERQSTKKGGDDKTK